MKTIVEDFIIELRYFELLKLGRSPIQLEELELKIENKNAQNIPMNRHINLPSHKNMIWLKK